MRIELIGNPIKGELMKFGGVTRALLIKSRT